MTREEVDKIKSLPFVFVLGKGRSGTTLLQALLNSHPNVVAPPESKFIVIHARGFGKLKKWRKADVHSFVDALFTEYYFISFWKQDKQKLTDLLLSAINYLDYPLACKLVYLHMRGKKQDVILLSDKNPFYALFISTILQVFPDAKFIHLVRNPKDNIASTLRAFSVKNTIHASYQWLVLNKIIERSKKRMPDRYFTLRYEDMVKNVQGTMEDVCTFLKIPYSEAMKDIDRNEIKDTYSYKPSVLQNKQSMLKPIDGSNIDKWKKELKPEDVAIVENITAKYAMQQYGYSMDNIDVYVRAPKLRIAIRRVIYAIWLSFTRFRYKRYNVHVLYSKFKRATNKNVMPEWGDVIR